MSRDAREQSPDPIWLPVVAPLIWSMHFTVCYIWAALACGRFGGAPLDSMLIALTAVAIVPIAVLFLRALTQLRFELPDQPHDDPTPEDRNKFMAFTTLLLAGMSGIGTLFVGVAAWAVGGCQ